MTPRSNSEVFACLEAICAEVDSSIRAVNSGGCGVFAASVAEQLLSIGVRARLRTYGDSCGANATRVAAALNGTADASEWWKRGVCFFHVKVQALGHMWDSEGPVPCRYAHGCWGRGLIRGHIPLPAFLPLLSSQSPNWNTEYDWAQNDKLRETVCRHFSLLSRGEYAGHLADGR